jgi:hypothetical protein
VTVRWHGYVRTLLALAAGCAPLARGGPEASPPAAVYLVIVDGLGADAATLEHMPRLAAAARPDGSWLTATAVMPTRTNPNHASLLTGAQPAAHGITGNWYWNGIAERELADPALLEVETLFTAIERQRPALTTVAAFAKAKLRRLFGPAPGRQSGPDVSWRPADDAVYAAHDAETMAGFRSLVETFRPAFAVVALADVDSAGHRDGPGTASYWKAVGNVDQLIGTLLDDLERTGRWDRAVVLVTSDHGMMALDRGPGGWIDAAAVAAGGAHFVSDGGLAHVYAGPPGSLEATVTKARRHEGVSAVYARAPRLGAPAPPVDWHANHPRMGDLTLVARPGFTFVAGRRDPTRRFRGNHGSPVERPVPLIVVGGHPALAEAPGGLQASVADVAPTIARLLDLAPPQRLNGTPVAAPDRGQVLEPLLGGQ